MFKSIKKLIPEEKLEGVLKLTFTILGISIAVLLSFVILKLNSIQETYESLADIEHLNANVQRVAKLSVVGQDVDTTLVYLDQEIQNLFMSGNKYSFKSVEKSVIYGVTDDLVKEWKLLKNLITAEELNENEIYLLSENFHFKSNELIIYIENEIDVMLKYVFIFHTLLSLISVIAALLSFSRILRIKTELEHCLELNEFSSIDISTGLYNRSKCQELFKRSVSITPDSNNAIIVFDLNDLKKANDNHGHQVGDELINSFANLLSQATKIHDQRPFLGRYGGDEFIVYYENLRDENDLSYFLCELKDLAEQFNFNKVEYQVSYAVGFAINSVKDSLTIRGLFDKADANMYTNKIKIKEGLEVDYPSFHDDADGRKKNFIPASSDLEKFFPNVQSKDEIDNKLRLSLIKNKKIITISTILLFTIGGITSLHDKVGKNYIDDNVLFLSATNSREAEDKIVSSPWKNTSLTNSLLYQTLFSTDSTFTQIKPALANQFEILNDGLTYKIHLKNDIFWSDGTKITTDDIVFSIETFLLSSDTDTNVATAFNKIVGSDNFKRGITSHLEGLRTDGDTLTINLDRKYNLFLSMLTQFAPLPKHILVDVDPSVINDDIAFYSNPVTSGMYLVDRLNDDGDMVLAHNPYYTGDTPNIDEVVLVSSFAPLDIDFYSTNVMSDVIDYRSIKDFTEYACDIHFYRYFVYNIQGKVGDEHNPISDIRVREALMYAIDRKHLLDIIYLNTGTIMAQQDEDGFAELDYPYSPNKARTLLEESDYDFDRPIKIMYYYNDDISHLFLEKVAEYLEDIGLKVELVKSTGSDDLYEIRDYDILLKSLSSFNEYDWYNEYISTNSTLSKVFGTEMFDELADSLFATIDAEEYTQILTELTTLESELIYKMPLYSFDQYVFLNSNKVKIPSGVTFGNNSYKYDIRFEDWSINKG